MTKNEKYSLIHNFPEVDAIQSRLEATTLMSEYFKTETDYKNMLSDLVIFEGRKEKV